MLFRFFFVPKPGSNVDISVNHIMRHFYKMCHVTLTLKQWPDYHIWRWWGWWWRWQARDHSSNPSFNILSAWHHWIFLVWPSGQKHWCLRQEVETFPVIFVETTGDSCQNMIIFQATIKWFLGLSPTRTIERDVHCQHLLPEFARINVDVFLQTTDVSKLSVWYDGTLLFFYVSF